jgi:hypothetical protein
MHNVDLLIESHTNFMFHFLRVVGTELKSVMLGMLTLTLKGWRGKRLTSMTQFT